MGFMQPQVYETDYLEIDGPMGTEIIPCDVADIQPCTCGFATAPSASAHQHHESCETQRTTKRSIPEEIADYCENRELWTIERKHGWVGRMSAPGYMDCTTWSACETEEAMRAMLANLYEDEE